MSLSLISIDCKKDNIFTQEPSGSQKHVGDCEQTSHVRSGLRMIFYATCQNHKFPCVLRNSLGRGRMHLLQVMIPEAVQITFRGPC
jgi:hypothetical protein